jgi:SAM-dependent methyltransferase
MSKHKTKQAKSADYMRMMGIAVASEMRKYHTTVEDRNRFYTEAGFPAMQIRNGRLEDVWWMGNSYGNKTPYHGSYPGNFLRRVMALFPDKTEVLHLFSGSLPPGDYTRFDRRTSTDLDHRQMDLLPQETNTDGFDVGLIRGEAENLSAYFPDRPFDLIIADPPYSVSDAEKYGTSLVNRTKVLNEAHKLLEPGGHIVWLDQIVPMFSNRDWKLEASTVVFIVDEDDWSIEGGLGILISTNHRPRGLFIFRKRFTNEVINDRRKKSNVDL